MYQSSIATSPVDRVERRVHERVGVDVELTPDVLEVHLVVPREQRAGAFVERLELRTLHPVATLQLTHEELRVGPHRQRPGTERLGDLECTDQRAVLGFV